MNDANPVESTDAVPLFPTFVWKTQFTRPCYEPMNARMLTRLRSLTADQPPLRPGEKYQTEQNLHLQPEFQDLADLALATSRGVLDFLKLVYSELQITGCWAKLSRAYNQ